MSGVFTKNFQAQVMQITNHEKQNSGKYIGIKYVKVRQHKTSLGLQAQ